MLDFGGTLGSGHSFQIGALSQDSTPTMYFLIHQIRFTFIMLIYCKCEIVKLFY